jgi:hypothetical protein
MDLITMLFIHLDVCFLIEVQLLEYLYTSGKLNLDINALITRHYTQRSVASINYIATSQLFKDVIQK